VTDYDVDNEVDFSAFMLALEIATTTDNDGPCLIHSQYGAVCLFYNTSTFDTYRFALTDWDSCVDDEADMDAVSACLLGITGGMIDTTEATLFEWFHAFYVTTGASLTNVAVAS